MDSTGAKEESMRIVDRRMHTLIGDRCGNCLESTGRYVSFLDERGWTKIWICKACIQKAADMMDSSPTEETP